MRQSPILSLVPKGFVNPPYESFHHLDVNRKDYRAWYGLGQAYELLNMHQYALYYYQHATALR